MPPRDRFDPRLLTIRLPRRGESGAFSGFFTLPPLTMTTTGEGRIGVAIALDVPMREPLVFRSESTVFGWDARELPGADGSVGWSWGCSSVGRAADF